MTMAITAMVLVFLIGWAPFACVRSSSDDCTVVSSVLESCYIALRPGTFFMRSESLCCKSLDILEKRIRDQELTRYAICECFKTSNNDQQVLLNENLLEVQALCGPHVPYPISASSDCVQYATEGMNIGSIIMVKESTSTLQNETLLIVRKIDQ